MCDLDQVRWGGGLGLDCFMESFAFPGSVLSVLLCAHAGSLPCVRTAARNGRGATAPWQRAPKRRTLVIHRRHHNTDSNTNPIRFKYKNAGRRALRRGAQCVPVPLFRAAAVGRRAGVRQGDGRGAHARGPRRRGALFAVCFIGLFWGRRDRPGGAGVRCGTRRSTKQRGRQTRSAFLHKQKQPRSAADHSHHQRRHLSRTIATQITIITSTQ